MASCLAPPTAGLTNSFSRCSQTSQSRGNGNKRQEPWVASMEGTRQGGVKNHQYQKAQSYNSSKIDRSSREAEVEVKRRHALLAAAFAPWVAPREASAEVEEKRKFEDMPALRGKDYGKRRTKYPDFEETDSGLQYKDLRVGAGEVPRQGQQLVVDWAGFTIGYYGRIFEARNKAKGGSFEGNEKGFFRFKLGEPGVIPAFEEAVAGMHVGGVRRIIVPPEIGYPNNDWTKANPKPATFSGQRALDFVLKNAGLIDKTLLFDIELIRADDPR